jgi:hypothetical protein
MDKPGCKMYRLSIECREAMGLAGKQAQASHRVPLMAPTGSVEVRRASLRQENRTRGREGNGAC